MFYTKHNKHTGKYLPHQKNDIKPEELHEHEQEPPVLLSEKEKQEALSAPPVKTSLPERHTDVHIAPPKPALSISDLTNPPNTKIIGIDPDSPIVPVTLKLLSKLGIIKNLQEKINKNSDEHIKEILKHAKRTHLVTLADVMRITNTKQAEANRYLKHLTKNKLLIKHGSGNKTFYKPL